MNSVCMATYNGEKFVAEQITSILSQLGEKDELVISDDGSSDGTISIINSFKDARIKLYHNNCRNPVKNFEKSLSLAKGDKIFLADQDDVWIEKKLEIMSRYLDEYDLVNSNSIVVNEQLKEINPDFFTLLHSGKGIIKNIIRSTYYGSCMAFRRSILDIALPFPETREIGHDLWLGLVAEMTGKVFFIQEPLLLYRRHEGSLTTVSSQRKARTKRSYLQIMRGRLIMTKEVILFYLKYKVKQCKKN